jgi:phosphoserine aminotransferase
MLCGKQQVYLDFGHRSVGGYRASMYNAMPIEKVQVLVDVMKALESKISIISTF